MRLWCNGKTRMKHIILDPSIKKLRCALGDISVWVESGDGERMEQLELPIIAVRVGNLFILCDFDEPALLRPASKECVSEKLPVPEREVEVFYWDEDDPFLHGMEAHYKSVQIGDVLFEVVREQTGCAEFMRCAFF